MTDMNPTSYICIICTPHFADVYRMCLYMHGVHLFKSYKASKINMEYDSHIPFI